MPVLLSRFLLALGKELAIIRGSCILSKKINRRGREERRERIEVNISNL